MASPETEQLLHALAETPRRIAAASQGLENAQLHFKPDEKAWSANDILAHLRACADVWGTSIIRMLAEDQPTWRYVSPRTWLRKKDYPELAFSTSFQAFMEQRNQLLQTLATITSEDWSRGAVINGREQTVFDYAQRLAQHEHEHCAQIEALLKSM